MAADSKVGVSALKAINPKYDVTYKDNGEAIAINPIKTDHLPK